MKKGMGWQGWVEVFGQSGLVPSFALRRATRMLDFVDTVQGPAGGTACYAASSALIVIESQVPERLIHSLTGSITALIRDGEYAKAML